MKVNMIVFFSVYNSGPSSIRKARLDIIWPSHFSDEKHLLYLIDAPEADPPHDVECRMEPIENMNPESLLVSSQSMNFSLL